jgi:hypothetical protein
MTRGSAEQAPAERHNTTKDGGIVIWMKTIVIDATGGLLAKAKEWARGGARMLRALVERGLRTVLGEPAAPKRPFKPVTGRLEPLPGVDPNDWQAIRASIYDDETY